MANHFPSENEGIVSHFHCKTEGKAKTASASATTPSILRIATVLWNPLGQHKENPSKIALPGITVIVVVRIIIIIIVIMVVIIIIVIRIIT